MKEEIKVGFNSHRLREDDPYYAEEILFVEKINKMMEFSDNFLATLVHHNDGKKYVYLDDNEEKVALSIIQWLGTPVGVGFLESCGYKKV